MNGEVHGEWLLVQIIAPAELARFSPAILSALEEIGRRSGGRYPAQVVLEEIGKRLCDLGRFALLLALDQAGVEAGKELNSCVVGLLTLDLVGDEIGMPVAFMSRAWARPDQRGKLWDVALAAAERWARRRHCVRLYTMTERSSASLTAQRSAVTSLRVWHGRMKGLRAYAWMMAQRGFGMRETIFEKRLSANGSSES